MVMLRHPLSLTEYHRNEDGTVRVIGKNGVEGTFTRSGKWISGQRRTADPALCHWIADGHLPRPRQADPRRPSFQSARESATVARTTEN